MKRTLFLLILMLALSCNSAIEQKSNANSQLPEVEQPPVDYNPEEKLSELKIELRNQGTPVANYVHAVQSGNLLFLAGKGPRQADGENIVGKVGTDLTLEEGYTAAREAGINQLSVLKSELGNLNKVKRIVQVKGMVNAGSDFKDHSKVVNGYSDLMVAVFGDKGKHARAAIGMGSLPGNMAVEIEMIVEVYE